MGEEKNPILKAFLGNGISQWLNNITEWEKAQCFNFVEDPGRSTTLIFNQEKIINSPLLISRACRIIEKYGPDAVHILNELFWGIPEDGKNTDIDSKRAINLANFVREKMKGGK